MSALLSLSYWLLMPETWVVLGIIMVVLEVTLSGSMVVFLPLGIAMAVNGMLISVSQGMPLDSKMPTIDTWEQTLFSFAVLAVIFSIILRVVARHRRTDDTPDVNDY